MQRIALEKWKGEQNQLNSKNKGTNKANYQHQQRTKTRIDLQKHHVAEGKLNNNAQSVHHQKSKR